MSETARSLMSRMKRLCGGKLKQNPPPVAWRGSVGLTLRSDAVIHLELDRVRRVLEGVDLFPLEVHVAAEEVVGEHVALLEEGVILLEVADGLAQGSAHRRHLLQLFRRQVVQVLVDGIAGMDLVRPAAGRAEEGADG